MRPATKRYGATPRVLYTLLLMALAGCGGDDAADSRAGEDFEGAAVAAESRSSTVDSGMGEVGDYRLSMRDVERWHEAQRNLYRRVEGDPELAREVSDLDLTGASIDELEDSFAGQPEILESIEASGLEPREFVLILFALYQATVADAMIQTGMDPDSILDSTGLHPDNLEFVRQNGARLEQLQAETDAMAPEEMEAGYEAESDEEY